MVLFPVIFSLLLACSVRYMPRVPGFQPGYTDIQLGENTYQIKIGEAWPKDWPDLEKFAMYRAAEITQSKGRRYFQIIKASSYTTDYEITAPSTSNTTATATRIGNTTYIQGTTTTIPGGTSTISGGWYVLEFKALADGEIAPGARIVDSKTIVEDLKIFIESRK